MADQSVLVLGSGYVGSAVGSRLKLDHDVIVRDVPDSPELGRRDAEARQLILDLVRSGVEVVVNTCGRLRGSDAELADANAEFPRWLVEVLEGTGVRFVHLGSAAEYGDPGSSTPIPESAEVDPVGGYATSKWDGSAAVLAATSAGLDVVVARPFNVVSSRVPPVSPVHQFIADVTALPPEGGEIEIWWPDTVRDFVFLDDLADWIATLVGAREVPDIINLCSGIGIGYSEIARAVAEVQGKVLTIRSLDRPGIPTVIGDPTRLAALCGPLPTISALAIAQRCGID
jgi:nucleoside-diphosphate-sugar epimerase